MFRSYRLGRVMGFPIDVNVSFLVLLGVAAIWMGGLAGVFTILVAFASVVLHELGHALVARRLGVHVSGIELYFFGGAAKLTQQPKTARDEIAIAGAGPLVSFALAALGYTLYVLVGGWFLQLFTAINIIIGAFNLIPALPMDGGRILRAALSYRFGFARATGYALRVAKVFAFAFGIFGLANGYYNLAILAVVIWFMGNAEMRAAHLGGYRTGQRVVPSTPSAHVGGVRIVRRGGRVIIETY